MGEHLVEQLNHVANDESGSYCEALVIINSGQEHYIMRRGSSTRKGFVYEKRAYASKDSLLKDFPGVYLRNGWEETDFQCGFKDIKALEFVEAGRRGFRTKLAGY